MKADQVYCVLDFETLSEVDIKRVGAYGYATHPSTRVLCVAWRIGTLDELRRGATKTKVWSPAIAAPYGELKRALLDKKIILVAHNAFFEQVIIRFVLSKLIHDPYLKNIPHERWICTASMARALAFPGKLVEACQALKLPVQKDMDGHRLMLKMCKPRRPSKNNPSRWHNKKSDLLRLMEYCATDVDAEIALLTTIPFLSPEERETWLLDQKINLRGFEADRELVTKILKMIPVEMDRFEREVRLVTGGQIRTLGQRDKILAWLKKNDCALPNLQKKTVEDAVNARLGNEDAFRLLLLRQEASKTSTAKYEAFEARSRTDGRVRDNLVYHTASTGRWGGAGVQPQNFPARGIVEDTDHACEILKEIDLEDIRLLWGNPLDFFSSLLRSMIRASEGKRLFGGDFAGIEVRVLFWMAKHWDGVQAFIDNRDLYCEIARVIYGYAVTKRNEPKERDVGKRAVLGCGFGMGAPKFEETCKEFGQEVDPDLALKAVKAYRSVHAPVVKMWSNLERAAIAAVKNPGKRYSINRTKWWIEGKYLYCELPSGRRLTYYGPEIRKQRTPWGEIRPVLYHWDIHPKTRKWVLMGTYGGKLTENVVQATARDFMVHAMKKAEAAGYEILITVHDELLAEKAKGAEKEFKAIMEDRPEWGHDCPIVAETWSGLRYKK